MQKEKRIQQRHLVRDAAVAIGFGIIGRVTDISLRGIGLKFFTRRPSALSLSDLELYLPEQNARFRLPRLPFRLVHISSINVSGIYFKNKCGIEFFALNKAQKKNLQDFIDHYTELITAS